MPASLWINPTRPHLLVHVIKAELLVRTVLKDWTWLLPLLNTRCFCGIWLNFVFSSCKWRSLKLVAVISCQWSLLYHVFAIYVLIEKEFRLCLNHLTSLVFPAVRHFVKVHLCWAVQLWHVFSIIWYSKADANLGPNGSLHSLHHLWRTLSSWLSLQ